MTIATATTAPAQDAMHVLIDTLIDTGQRIEELTNGKVDTVSDSRGRTFILRHAQAQLRNAEAVRQSAILDALPGHIALIDNQGAITAVNEAWRTFALGNMLDDETFGVGSNYLRVCDDADASVTDARLVAEGVRAVLGRTAMAFSHEYACHSARDQRWFHMTVTPIAAGALVMHSAITERRNAQDAMQALAKQTEQRERILSATLSSISDFAYIFDREGRFLFVNQPLLKLWGLPLEAAVGRNFSELGYPADLAAKLQREVQYVFETRKTVTGETPYTSPSGAEGSYEYIFSPDISADGTVAFVAGSTRDVTERKANEKHLAQMESRYRGLLEAAPDAMVVVDERGAIVLVNVQAEKQFGYRRDELLGQQVSNIIPEGFAERIIADGTRTAAEALAQQIGTGIELLALRKNGTEFPIEMMLSPLESDDGILVTAAIRDISARRAAEKYLGQMEGRYRGLLEAAPDAMVVVNQAGEIVLLNVRAQKQFGYRRDELLGQQVKNIIPEGFAERLIADGTRSAAEALAQQIGTGIELSARRKDGSEFPIEIMLSPLGDADGILVTAAIRDISSRKESKELLLLTVAELRRSNEELEHFAYLASHDLQEPLRMVASYTQLLARRYKGKLDSDADEFIAFAVDGASRMQRLIQDLLTYSRVGTNGGEMLATPSQRALDEALANLRASIEDSGAVVTQDPMPVVVADEIQLVQLFQNLIGNAIKYQDHGAPQIHVSAVRSGADWSFSVRDNGLGIEEKYFDRIFGMFQRLHGRTEYTGTGIGLAICKKIVERHGGVISVESETGKGSTFRFALTASESQPVNEEA